MHYKWFNKEEVKCLPSAGRSHRGSTAKKSKTISLNLFLWFQTCIRGVFIPSVPSKLEEGQLTTSTLCLPGGWGMEYLMKPWVGKGCSKKEEVSKWVKVFHVRVFQRVYFFILCMWLPAQGLLRPCQGICEDRSEGNHKMNKQQQSWNKLHQEQQK